MQPDSQREAERVVRFYASTVYRLALAATKNSADADDVFQEVFLRYFKQGREFDGEEHRKAWLIRVTVNCARKLQSSAWFRRTAPLEDHPVFDEPNEREIEAALARLKPKYRAAVHLFYYEDYSAKQIAEAMSLSESHVRTLLTRARAQLKELLKGEYHDI